MDFTWIAPIPASIIDAKGDLIAGTAADTASRLAVGTDGYLLSADSSTATGLKWVASPTDENWTLLNAGGTALTGATTITVNITAYNKLWIRVDGASSANASSFMTLRYNGDTAANYNNVAFGWTYGTNTADYDYTAGTSTTVCKMGSSVANIVLANAYLSGGKGTGVKTILYNSTGAGASGSISYNGSTTYVGTAAITSVSIISSTGNFDAGTIYVYGAN